MLRIRLIIHVWIASGFAFAGDAVGLKYRTRHCELRSREEIRDKYRSFVYVCVT